MLLVGKSSSLFFSNSIKLIPSNRQIRTLPKRKLPIPKTERRLDVAIVGAPNAGKSVVLNSLIKERLAATSHKQHTTRSQILGVFNHNNIQLAFYDTPGFVRSIEARKLETKSLRNIVVGAASRADVVIIVVDSVRDITPDFQDTFAEIARIALDSAKIEIILVLNKVDLVVPKVKLLEVTRTLVSLINGVKLGVENSHLAQLDTTTFMISALHNDGVLDLKNYLLSLSQPKPWIIPKASGSITDLSSEERVEQIVLEMMLEHTHEEIPYIAKINCQGISNINSSRIKIEVDIIVETTGQQRIIVGHQGRTLVKLRQSSVEVLEKIFKKQIILMIYAKTTAEEKKKISSDRIKTVLTRNKSLGVGEGEEIDDDDDDEDDDEINDDGRKDKFRKEKY